MSTLSYLTPNFTPFQSSGGMCYPSTDYAGINQRGGGNYCGDGLIPTSTGKNMYLATDYGVDYDKVSKDNYGIDYSTAFGGAKMNKGKKSKKTKETKKKSTTAKKKKAKKPTMKMMWGGQESSGATPMDQRYFNPNMHIVNYPANSGMGVKSAYGPIELGDAGVGMLAPYSLSANSSSLMQTGGSKSKSKSSSSNKNSESSSSKKNSKSSSSKKNSRSSSDKNKNKNSKRRTMYGGQESSGATPMDQRFYDANMKVLDYPANSGMGVQSAYGQIELGDAGVGMLAPYTSSNCSSANHSSGMQTGGAKTMKKKKMTEKEKLMKKKKNTLKKKKMMIGGRGINEPIPAISDVPVTAVQNGVNGAVGSLTQFLSQLDSDYEKSLDVIRSVKIGNQRLIQAGGSKEKKMMMMEKKKMMSLKEKERMMKMKEKEKMMKMKEREKMMKMKEKEKMMKMKEKEKKMKMMLKKKMMKGGDGSDFATTLSSRGPVNAPDGYWGVDGETWFRQFNKTGEYIPNSLLPGAATPGLIGQNSSCVSGYDSMDLNYPAMGQN
jgi:hypothetical protein